MDHDRFAREVAALAESHGFRADFASASATDTGYLLTAPDGSRLRVTVAWCPPERRTDVRPLGAVLSDWPEHGPEVGL